MARGSDDFGRLLSKYRELLAWAAGSAAAPFAAQLLDLSPPWPKGVVLVTAVVELLVLALVFQFLQKAGKKRINATMVAGVLALAAAGTAYLWQASLYTYEVPTTKERFVKGDECTANAREVYREQCPELGPDELREAGYSAERLWTSGSIAAVRLRLVLLWAVSFVALSAALGSFLVFQLRRNRPKQAKSRPATSTAPGSPPRRPRKPVGAPTPPAGPAPPP